MADRTWRVLSRASKSHHFAKRASASSPLSFFEPEDDMRGMTPGRKPSLVQASDPVESGMDALLASKEDIDMSYAAPAHTTRSNDLQEWVADHRRKWNELHAPRARKPVAFETFTASTTSRLWGKKRENERQQHFRNLEEVARWTMIQHGTMPLAN